MTRFTDVNGRLRFEIVRDMVTSCSGPEAVASREGDDPKVRAARRYWDRVGPGAIAVVQHFSGERLPTMLELRSWLREHDDPKKPPWDS
jgi:hypothetical protein